MSRWNPFVRYGVNVPTLDDLRECIPAFTASEVSSIRQGRNKTPVASVAMYIPARPARQGDCCNEEVK